MAAKSPPRGACRTNCQCPTLGTGGRCTNRPRPICGDPIPPSTGPRGSVAREPRAEKKTSPYVRNSADRRMGIFGEFPRYGCFRYCDRRLRRRGVYFRLCFVDLSRTAELKSTSRRLSPLSLLTAPSIWDEWRRRTLSGCPAQNSNLLFLSAKFAPPGLSELTPDGRH